MAQLDPMEVHFFFTPATNWAFWFILIFQIYRYGIWKGMIITDSKRGTHQKEGSLSRWPSPFVTSWVTIEQESRGRLQFFPFFFLLSLAPSPPSIHPDWYIERGRVQGWDILFRFVEPGHGQYVIYPYVLFSLFSFNVYRYIYFSSFPHLKKKKNPFLFIYLPFFFFLLLHIATGHVRVIAGPIEQAPCFGRDKS